MTDRIRLLIDLPVEPAHGANKGAEFDVLRTEGRKVWFMGADGEECAAFHREIEFVE